jgi:hypothetical protein
VLSGFFRSLGLVGEDPDAPREFLVLLEPLVGDIQEYERLYQETVREALRERLRGCADEGERTRLLTLAGLSGGDSVSASQGKAALIREALPLLQRYRSAAARLDSVAADAAIQKAEAQAGTSFPDLQEMAKKLKTERSRLQSLKRRPERHHGGKASAVSMQTPAPGCGDDTADGGG